MILNALRAFVATGRTASARAAAQAKRDLVSARLEKYVLTDTAAAHARRAEPTAALPPPTPVGDSATSQGRPHASGVTGR